MGSSEPAKFKLVVRYWLNDSHVFCYVIVAILVSVGQTWREREIEYVRMYICARERVEEKEEREQTGRQSARIRWPRDEREKGKMTETSNLGKRESNIEQG